MTIISDWFQDCEYLLSIEIPGSVGIIAKYAFCGCLRLEKITVAESNPAYETDDAGVLYNKGKSILIYCPAEVKEVSIPGSVETIEEYAFYDCKKLEKITVDKSNSAYESDDAGVLYNKGKTTLLYCPLGCKEASIKIPDGMMRIEDNTFFDCKSLLRIKIPESVTHIGNSAFSGCESLSSINIPGSVGIIGEFAFWDCVSLLNVNIPSSVSIIGEHAFKYTSLLNINIPGSVSSIGKYAFTDCPKLEKIIVDESNPVYESDDVGMLYNKGKTTLICCPAGCKETEIRIPSSVSVIGEFAFSDCTNLVSIDIPSGVACIENGAFSHCTNLTKIAIPDSVSSIGFEAFEYCESLLSIEIPDSVRSIERAAFGGCESLTKIEIPEGVSIDIREAFYGCESLESIKISISVSSIVRNALVECTSLKDIYYAGSREQWDVIEIDMDGNDALESARIHYGSN